jgi:DNA invertase Pin-like site-specific DNA recombinase
MNTRNHLAQTLAAGDAKVYSYMRFSHIKQSDGDSALRQRTYAEKWARERGLKLDAELTMLDKGFSAFHNVHVTHGAFGLFLKAIEAGTVKPGSVLIVEDLDRVSRAEPLIAQAMLTQILIAGITVVTLSDDQVYSREIIKADATKLIFSLLKFMRSNDESARKSVRIKSSIANACRAWIAGDRTGKPIRAGKVPHWLEHVGGRWQFQAERKAAIDLAVAMYREGKGGPFIAAHMNASGMQVSDATNVTGTHIRRMFTNPCLYGLKTVEVDGEVFELHDYYPAVMTREQWVELQDLAKTRTREGIRGTLPSLLTGFDVTRCGYCTGPMIAMNYVALSGRKQVNGGPMADGYRRLRCCGQKDGTCKVVGSCSAAPIERVIMGFCSSMFNLQSLYGGDRTAIPQRNLDALRAKLADVHARITRLGDSLEDGTGNSAELKARLRARENERDELTGQVQQAEVDLRKLQRANIVDADVRWQSVVDGVNALDYDTRLQARQLVADTFETIVVYHHGVRQKGPVDVVLTAKGGNVSAVLRITDPKAGTWQVVIDDVSGMLPTAPRQSKKWGKRKRPEALAA